MKTAPPVAKINFVHGFTALHEALLATVDALSRRRAADIPEKTIAHFVQIRWLEWNGGGLRLTPAGEGVLLKVQATMLAQMQPG